MKTTLNVVGSAAMASFQGAAEAFAQNPNGDNFNDLLETMMVQQALRGNSSIQKEQLDSLLAKLGTAPTADWNALIYKELAGADLSKGVSAISDALVRIHTNKPSAKK